jgi:DNA-binding transcriptional regulator YiaG
VRQLLRSWPLETVEIEVRGKPAAAEILRIKAWLALSRNQTHDYLDIAALADLIGLDGAPPCWPASMTTTPTSTPGQRPSSPTAWGEHYRPDALMSNTIRHARQDITRGERAAHAAQIRSWRTPSGMTLRQLARAAGTSPSRLSDDENAEVAPTTDALARLKHATGAGPREALNRGVAGRSAAR